MVSLVKQETQELKSTISEPLCPYLPEKRPCIFYKLMVAPILQENKLRIPDKFVKKYGNELSSIATLAVPNGHNWVVSLKKVNGKLWLDMGWQEFVEYYSILVGHFLVFRYDGNSHFSIHIFDLANSEIKYPSNPSKSSHECSIHGNRDARGRDNASCRCRCDEFILRNNRTCGAGVENVYLRKCTNESRAGCGPTRDVGVQSDEAELTSNCNDYGGGDDDEERCHFGQHWPKRMKRGDELCKL